MLQPPLSFNKEKILQNRLGHTPSIAFRQPDKEMMYRPHGYLRPQPPRTSHHPTQVRAPNCEAPPEQSCCSGPTHSPCDVQPQAKAIALLATAAATAARSHVERVGNDLVLS